MIERDAGRALVLAPTGRIVLIRGSDPADADRGGFWFTPGGGLDPGESLDAGTKRELAEELGLDVGRLGPVVMERVDEFPIAGERYRQTETVFLVEVDAEFDPAPRLLEELELSVIDEMRWLGLDELRALEEPVYPTKLVDLLAEILTNGPPREPWREDLTVEQ